MTPPLIRSHCPAATPFAPDAGACTRSVKFVTKASIVSCAWRRIVESWLSIPLSTRSSMKIKTLLHAMTNSWFAIMSPVTKTSSIAHSRPAIAVSRAHQRHGAPHCLPLFQLCHVARTRSTSSVLGAISTVTIDLYCVLSRGCGLRSAAMTARRQTGSRAIRRSVANVRALSRRMVAASMSIPSLRIIRGCLIIHSLSHMTCKKCKYEFCWVCMGMISPCITIA